MILASIAVALLLLISGTPLAFVLALLSAMLLYLEGIPVTQVMQSMFAGADSWVLLAIPLFVLAGTIMEQGGITKRLIDFTASVFGSMKGALAVVNVAVSMLFGGASGSAVADTAAVGTVLIPAMTEEGYDIDFSAAVTASSSPIGIIIPPSIPMVIYGWVTNTSVGALFLGGIGAGILVGVAEILTVLLLTRKRNYGKPRPFSWTRLFTTARDGIPALLAPVILLGGIIAGVFTPTEAAGAAVLYSLFLGFFVFKELRLADMPGILVKAATMTGLVMLVVCAANSLCYVLALHSVPQLVSSWASAVFTNPTTLLIAVTGVFLLLGMFLGVNEAIILAVPILLPAMQAVGIDPIHAGVVIVVTAGIGLLTPPVALCIFMASTITKRPMESILRACVPFMITIYTVVLILIFVPSVVMLLPRLTGKG